MLETIIKLLERFVVAHELIAANSAKQPATLNVANHTTKPVELKGEGEEVIDTKPANTKTKPENDLNEENLEYKPKRKTQQAKPKDDLKGSGIAAMREEIKAIARAIASGDSDECADKFDGLLGEYKVRTVTKLADEEVESFLKDTTHLVSKYYEIEQ